MDGVSCLDLDKTKTQSLRSYREQRVSYSDDYSNDFTDRIVSRRDCHLLIIGVHYNVGPVHIVEHDLIKSKQDSDGNDGWILELVMVVLIKHAVSGYPLDEYGVVYGLSLFTKRLVV